jgi:hypothetical protein
MTVERVAPLPLAGLEVVVVDDDRVSLIAITSIVGSWGARIRSASSGRGALRLIVAAPPDILLADLHMPEMDGFELMRRVRELPPAHGGRTPGIAITAHPSFESRRDAVRAGYGSVFSKPFVREELIDSILRVAISVRLSQS